MFLSRTLERRGEGWGGDVGREVGWVLKVRWAETVLRTFLM